MVPRLAADYHPWYTNDGMWMAEICTAMMFLAARRDLRLVLREERGATSLEYAIVASAIAAVIILGVAFLGRATNDNFDCTGRSYETRTNQC